MQPATVHTQGVTSENIAPLAMRTILPPSITYPPYRLSWFLSCLEILLPTQCTICHRPLRGCTMCYRCRPPLPNLADLTARSCSRCFSPRTTSVADQCETCGLFPPLTDSMRFLWEYDGLARDLIRTIKYRPSISLAGLAGRLLGDAALYLFQPASWDLIIPIPSSRPMFRKRLFHPCVELARPLAHATKTPIIHALRHDPTRAPQASLSHDERLKRLRSLFSLTKRFNACEKRILLVEDVITTGATISAAAHTLKQAGATRVDVLALARTRVWSRFRHRIHETFQDTSRRRPRRMIEQSRL